MSVSISEKGRAITLSNFNKLYSSLLYLGPPYKTPNANMQPAALLAQYTAARTVLSTHNQLEGPFKKVIKERRVAFAPISKLLTRLRGAVAATDTPKAMKKEYLKNVSTLVRQYRGIRADGTNVIIPPATGTEASTQPDTISVAHLSFVQKTNTLQQLMVLLANIPQYAPNEADLQMGALNNVYDTLDNLNTASNHTIVAYTTARNALKTALDADDTGIVDIALAVKNAVKSAFGSTSHEYRLVSPLIFNRE